jgi:hypothetical protein
MRRFGGSEVYGESRGMSSPGTVTLDARIEALAAEIDELRLAFDDIKEAGEHLSTVRQRARSLADPDAFFERAGERTAQECERWLAAGAER